MQLTHGGFARHYRPEDMYTGNFVSALQALDCGVTTVVDNSNNSQSLDHSSAAVEALLASGIRAVHANGPAAGGPPQQEWLAQVLRLRSDYFSSPDQLVSLRLFDAGPDARVWKFAR